MTIRTGYGSAVRLRSQGRSLPIVPKDLGDGGDLKKDTFESANKWSPKTDCELVEKEQTGLEIWIESATTTKIFRISS